MELHVVNEAAPAAGPSKQEAAAAGNPAPAASSPAAAAEPTYVDQRPAAADVRRGVVYTVQVPDPPGLNKSKIGEEKKTAPLGRWPDGTPYAPYGTTPGGKIRRRPVARPDANKPKDQAPPTAGHKVPPGQAANLYAQLDTNVAHQKKIIEAIKAAHPETELQAIDPRDIKARLHRADPITGPAVIEDFLSSTTEFVRVRGKFEHGPNPATIKEAAAKIAEASKYYGVLWDPKKALTIAAVFATLGCFGGFFLEGLGRFLDGVAAGADDDQQLPDVPIKQQGPEA